MKNDEDIREARVSAAQIITSTERARPSPLGLEPEIALLKLVGIVVNLLGSIVLELRALNKKGKG